MISALCGYPSMQGKSLMIGLIAFGVLVGLTAGTIVLTLSGGVMAAILAYAVAGSLGMLGMAATELR